MPLDFEHAANDMVDQFVGGQLGSICKYYAFPAAIYIGPDVLIIWSEDELFKALRIYRGVLQTEGLAMVKTTILDTTPTEGSGFTVSVENAYLDKRGEQIGTAHIRYFLQSFVPCPKIRLVEYLDWPCGEQLAADPEFRALINASNGMSGKRPRQVV